MNRENAPRFRRVWLRNTLVIGGLALVALIALKGPRLRLALVAAAGLELWNTVTIIRSWLFAAEYRYLWWWRR